MIRSRDNNQVESQLRPIDVQAEPSVYVIVLNWNRADDTIACLESLFQLDYAQLRIVIVDNGSTDDSLTRFAAYADRVEVLTIDQNLGFAGGNNYGMKFALAEGADYVMLLNNDTIVAPDMLRRLMAVVAADETLGVVGPSIYYMERPDELWFSGMSFPFQIYFIGRHLMVQPGREAKKFVEFISGCCLLIKSTVLERVGFLDASYFMYYEDLDLCLRVQKAGFKLAYVPAAKMWHKVSASTGGKSSPLKQYYQVKSSILFFRRHVTGLRLLISVMARLLHASGTVLRELLAGRVTREMMRKYLQGVGEALWKRS